MRFFLFPLPCSLCSLCLCVSGAKRVFSRWLSRADWDSKDLQDASSGHMSFTAQQVAIIRAEVARRVAQHDAACVAAGGTR